VDEDVADRMRPPGLSTRNISRNTPTLSGQRLTTPLLITTSATASPTGERLGETLADLDVGKPQLRAPRPVFSRISAVMSMGEDVAPGPTWPAAMSVSKPAPQPTSTTVSP
jgi:hypothetical protein